MSKAWIRAKLPEFARDVMRDFCLASQELEYLFGEFDRMRQVEFESLRDLLGQEMNKGLLWRLKDTAHHVFRNDPDESLIGRFLDWGLGYIFHEAMKLKEDAYQQQNYAPWFKKLESRRMPGMEKRFRGELTRLVFQTLESTEREIKRIRFILGQCRAMFPSYFRRHKNNALLARFLFMQDELVKSIFQDGYQDLVAGIYEDEPELMYILAAQDLRQGGWIADAAKAGRMALKINPDNPAGQKEMKLIENSDNYPRRKGGV